MVTSMKDFTTSGEYEWQMRDLFNRQKKLRDAFTDRKLSNESYKKVLEDTIAQNRLIVKPEPKRVKTEFSSLSKKNFFAGTKLETPTLVSSVR